MILPKELFLIRHGESIANCARRNAEDSNSAEICFEGREADVPLSELGKVQCEALGNWFSSLDAKPTVIISSPFARASETAKAIAAKIESELGEIVDDERIRERELGVFDRLTKSGAILKYPEECEKREITGKFYYRPSGGESWADVALRVRGFLADFSNVIEEERVVILTHEVVIRLFRYVLENLTESQILAIDRAGDVENGAITSYITKNGKISLNLENYLPK